MGNNVHIRSNNTGRYLDSAGSWCEPRCDARVFASAADAKNWCATASLDGVEIVIVREGLICMRMPLRKRS